MARRDEGGYPQRSLTEEATKPGDLFRKNPPGGGSFVRGLRWLSRYSPLRGCSGLAAGPHRILKQALSVLTGDVILLTV